GGAGWRWGRPGRHCLRGGAQALAPRGAAGRRARPDPERRPVARQWRHAPRPRRPRGGHRARRVVDGAAPSRPPAPAPGRRGRAVGAGPLARARVTMSGWVDTVLVLIALTSFVLLGSSRLGSCIRVVALQGVLLGYLTLTARGDESALRTGLLAAGSAGLKGIVFPWLLSRALREA